MTPSWWAMIAVTSHSCVYGWRVVGFGCGACRRGLWVLSPLEPMTFMSQRSGRVVGRTAGKGICTSTAGSFGRLRSLLAPALALTLAVKVIEVADSVSFTASCDWAFSSLTDSWSASTAARRRSASWSLFQRVDDLLIARHISTRLHSSVCIVFFFIVYRSLTFLPDWMEMKRLHTLTHVIERDMSNYFVVWDPGSRYGSVRADPSAGWHRADSRWLYIQTGLTSKLLLHQSD